MKYLFYWIPLVILFNNPGFGITAGEVLQNADKCRSVGLNFEFRLQMGDYKKGELSEKSFLYGYVKGYDKSMVVFKEPSSMKGRKILMIGDDMWIFIPNTKRPVRLTPSQRLFGQASNGDVAKVRFSYDYAAALNGTEMISDMTTDRECYRLGLEAKRIGATYNKIVLWVETKTFYPVKAEYFALSGKKLKTAYYSGAREIEGKTVVTKTVIYDEVIKDNFTVMEYIEMKEMDVEDKYFNKEFLQRM